MENFVVGDTTIFKIEGSPENGLNGAEFRVISVMDTSCLMECIFLPNGKENIVISNRNFIIGYRCFISKIALIKKKIPYVYQPIKHAYFYHSVGD